MVKSKNYPFGVNTTIELIYIYTYIHTHTHTHTHTHAHAHHNHQTIRCGYYQGKSGCASLQQQQRRFAQSCGRHLSHNYSKNAPTYVTEDMEAHPFVCPASRCTYGFTGHVTKAYVSDSNQISGVCYDKEVCRYCRM